MVPHVTDAIQDWIMDVASKPVDNSGCRADVCLVELGGTVGDIESAVYLEALQQLNFRIGPENFMMVHLGFIPELSATGEQKNKTNATQRQAHARSWFEARFAFLP